MLIQHLDDSREGGLAGGAAEEDVKDLQARLQLLRLHLVHKQGCAARSRVKHQRRFSVGVESCFHQLFGICDAG